MRRILAVFFIGAVLFNLFIPISSIATIQSRTITFDETLTGPFSTRYEKVGVRLSKWAQITSITNKYPQSNAYSKPNVLVSSYLGNEQDPKPLIIQFTYDVLKVAFYTGVPWNSYGKSVEIVVRAYNKYGALVGVQSTKVKGPTNINVELAVKPSSISQFIRKIEVDCGYFEVIDNLRFWWEDTTPPSLPTKPPVVTIISPTAKETNTGKITISGTITGEGLDPELLPPKLNISYAVDSEFKKLGMPSSSETDLSYGFNVYWVKSKTLPYLTFSLPYELNYLGKNTITVSATNSAGTGSVQTIIEYWPQAITEEAGKWIDAHGKSYFQNFIWGTTIGNCTFAIYEDNAIFSSSAGTFPVGYKTLLKWKSLTSPGNVLGLLGCPTSESRTPEGYRWGLEQNGRVSISKASCQDFVGGRIYNGPKGTYYVVEPFIDAIDKLNFDVNCGLPVTDPIQQNKPGLPILWQKFETTDCVWYYTGLGFSTMEVTKTSIDGGVNPLTLWIATPNIYGAQKAGVFNPPPEYYQDMVPRIPTVWRCYPCAKIGEPAHFVGILPSYGIPQPRPKLDYLSLENRCEWTTYPWGVAQWVPIYGKKKIFATIGTVESSGLASEDAPFNHFCSEGLSADGEDWCIYIVPDQGFENILGEKQDYLQIEYEYCLVGYPWEDGANPFYPNKKQSDYLVQGDKRFLAGRWIADCGHDDPYRTEIHPPAVMIDMYTEKRYGKPETIGEMIYFDWWYPGESVEVDIFPPPRPTPDAYLIASLPNWNGDVQHTMLPKGSWNHVHLKITGRTDIPKSHLPPSEDEGNGQLFHNRAAYYPWDWESAPKSQWGEYVLRWYSQENKK